MNWSKGFARLSYCILAVGVLVGLLAAVFGGPEKMGGWLVGTLVFAGCWLALHRACAWIARGFSEPGH